MTPALMGSWLKPDGRILCFRSGPNEEKGERVKNSVQFADYICVDERAMLAATPPMRFRRSKSR